MLAQDQDQVTIPKAYLALLEKHSECLQSIEDLDILTQFEWLAVAELTKEHKA